MAELLRNFTRKGVRPPIGLSAGDWQCRDFGAGDRKIIKYFASGTFFEVRSYSRFERTKDPLSRGKTAKPQILVLITIE